MLKSTATKVKRELRKHGATSEQAQTYIDLVCRFEQESSGKGEFHHILPKNCGWWKQYEQVKWNFVQVRWGFHISLHGYLAAIFPHSFRLLRGIRGAAIHRREESQKKRNNRSEIIRRYKEGWSASRIGRRWRITPTQVIMWLQEWGIATRGRRQARHFRKKRKWLKKIIALYKRGYTLREIMKITDIPQGTIRAWLIEAKVPIFPSNRKYHVIRERKLPKVVKMYLEGKSSTEIAKKVDMDPSVIADWLHFANVKLRPAGWRPKLGRIPPRIVSKAIRFYQTGFSIKEAARKVGFAPETLAKHLRLRNVDRRPCWETRTGVKKEEVKNDVISLYRQGKSSTFLGQKFKVGRQTILNWLRIWGEPVRRPKEPVLRRVA